jgi:asparagine synthase (glutamine-hydrolysing)
MRMASKYVTVLLSGQGGDELFAGYIPYFVSYARTAMQQGKYLELTREMLMGADIYWPYLMQIIKGKFNNDNAIKISKFINPEFFPNREFKYVLEENLNKRLYKDLSEFSLTNVLRYEDKNAMAFSIETRVPFLDHKFVEFVLALPIDQKIKYGWNRYVYRNAMKGIIPEEIRLRRKKIGFTTPEVRWLKAKAKQIGELFTSAEFKSMQIFNKDVASEFKLWAGGQKSGDGLIFWRVLNTYLWIKRFDITL